MIKRLCSALVLFGLTASAMAQIQVDVVTDQVTFLPHENLVVTVRITNFSGQELKLGEDDSWLRFGVQARDGFIVPKLSDVPVKTPFTVKPSEVGVRRVNLAPHYELTRPGRYQVIANVKLPGWDRDFQSPPKDFDITSGAVIWQQDFGVPGSTQSGGPEIRKFALLQSNQLRETKLYFRLSDATGGDVYRIYPIGTLVSFGNPERQIDPQGNLHVLHQYSARLYNYVVITPDGVLKTRETYEITGSRPKLRGNEAGLVEVVGGMVKQPPREVPTLPGSPGEDYRQGNEAAAPAPAPAPETKDDKKGSKTKKKDSKPKKSEPKP